MTKQQERQIEMIKNQALNFMGKYSENYEIKQFEVRESDYSLSLYVEVGLKGDEETLAAIYGRNSTMVFIGARGKLQVCSRNRKGEFTFKPYKSFIGACLDYNKR